MTMTMTMENSGHGAGGRERLLAAALELFLEAGYEGVSMQQIADAAAMTKGAPYHHFSSKEDLFGQALARHFERIQSGLTTLAREHSSLREQMVETLTYLVGHSDAGMVRLVDDLRRRVGVERMMQFGVSLDRLRECDRRLFEEAVAVGVSLSCSPEQAADLFLAVQIGELSLLEIESGSQKAPGEIRARARWIVDALLSGLVADAPVAAPVAAPSVAPIPDRSVGRHDAARDERC